MFVRWTSIVAMGIALGAAGCQQRDTAGSQCGLLGCISSPYLAARGKNLVGADVATAVSTMGGTPSGVLQADATTTIMTWARQQNTPDFGLLACSETLYFQSGRVVKYEKRGHCGL